MVVYGLMSLMPPTRKYFSFTRKKYRTKVWSLSPIELSTALTQFRCLRWVGLQDCWEASSSESECL